jgi:hypothetical protein
MDHADLKSAAAEVLSIAAEAQLFTAAVQEGCTTPTYARTHPRYLERLADSAAQRLAKAKAGPEIQSAVLEQLKSEANALEAAVARLSGAIDDPGALISLHSEFANLARRLRQIGQLL